MSAAREGAGGRHPDAAAFQPARRPVRGVNLLAELEALVAIGAGRFDVGVHHVVNLFRGRSLAALSGVPQAAPFAGREDRRHWVAHVYDEDAYLLARMDGGLALALSGALAAAWPHLPHALRERAEARVEELDDGIGRAWLHAGGAPLWRPQPARTLQSHLVVADEAAPHRVDVAR